MMYPVRFARGVDRAGRRKEGMSGDPHSRPMAGLHMRSGASHASTEDNDG
jgi:hypothetical protein